jgi:hypothetical protein
MRNPNLFNMTHCGKSPSPLFGLIQEDAGYGVSFSGRQLLNKVKRCQCPVSRITAEVE